MNSDNIIKNNLRSKTDYELYMLINFDADQYTADALEEAKKEYVLRDIEESQDFFFKDQLEVFKQENNDYYKSQMQDLFGVEKSEDRYLMASTSSVHQLQTNLLKNNC